MRRGVAALALLGLGVSGCAAASATKTPPSTPMASPPTSGPEPETNGRPSRRLAGPPCQTWQVNISLGHYTAEDVGPHHAVIVITNTEAPTCQVFGYPGLTFYGPHRHKMNLALSHYSYPVAPTVVPLRRGQSAWTEIDWTLWDPNAYVKVGSCQPAPTTLSVTPPGETESVPLKWEGGRRCWAGWLGVQPLRSGATGKPGTA